MHILLIGHSFKTSPLEVREALCLRPDEEEEVGARLKGACAGLVVLSTCHRTELYLECEDPERSLQCCHEFLARRAKLDVEAARRYAYHATGLQAAGHLLRVASGLDSVVVGEGQILGQVGRAYDRALGRQQVTPLLSSLFRRALALGKRVRTQAGLGKKPASLSAIAQTLARETLGALEGATALVIGGGEMGLEMGKALADGKVGRLLLVSRTYTRAQEMAALLGGDAVPFEQIGELLGSCDVVVAASGAPGYVMAEEAIRKAAVSRKQPLLLIDLGVPRNIPPEVAQLPEVILHNVDDLQAAVQSRVVAEKEAVEKAEALVEEELSRFSSWLEQRPVEETIGALGRELDRIRRGEMARALPRLRGLSPEQTEVLEAMTTAMVKKFLYAPARTLREKITVQEADPYLHALEELFLRAEEVSANGP
ncbi:MAG: glutamyl-tRNA reductase [Chloroflexi bacterium]|nr:glutamyl-tRNA reductase [Chloroflexota bacterium]